MKRSELEHVVRAASAITLHRDFIVVGSQALLGEHPGAPRELLHSVEIDLYPREKPEDSILIDGAIGEGSTFHETFGYYGHGIGPQTATLPGGWQDRLIVIENENTGGARAWCLETHDLAVSKLVAGRPKDSDFVQCLLRHRLVDPVTLAERLAATSLEEPLRQECAGRLARLVGGDQP